METKKLAEMVHETSQNNGWWPENKMERSVPEMLLLLHRNVSKATDAYRNKFSPVENHDWETVFAEGLADVAIQLLDMCEGLEIDLESAILAKHEINKKRTYRHGNKAC